MAQIQDALAASALVTAVLAALFTLWQADVQKALDLPKRDDRANRGPEKTKVQAALWTRAVPLFATSGATLLILANRSWKIACEAHACTPSTCVYDDVKALVVLTEVLILILWVAVAAQIVALLVKARDLAS
jgi:hypothetical protein